METHAKKRIARFIICLVLAFQTMSLVATYNSFAGVISKDEKTMNEAKTGKSAEKALIEQKMREQTQQQDEYVYETVKKKQLETTRARETTKARDTSRAGELHQAREQIKAPVNNYPEYVREQLTSPSSDLPNRNEQNLLTPTGVAAERYKEVYTAPSGRAQAQDSMLTPSGRASVKLPETAGITPKLIKVVVPEEKYEPPKAQSQVKSIFEALSEPTAGAFENKYVEANNAPPAIEESETYERIRFKGKNLIEAKSEQKKFIDFTNSSNNEQTDTESGDNSGRVIGTQLGHTQLYDNLFDKNRVIAAGGGGGLGEGGGAVKQEDHGSGGTSYTLTDSFSNMPSEVTISHVTTDDPGNDLVNETIGKAREEGEYNEADKGNFAGKKIFEIDRNGDLGIDNRPEGIDNGRLIMLLGIAGTFIVGMLSYLATSYNIRRRQEFF